MLRLQGAAVDAINPSVELTEADRIDRLRLIRSDNVGPRTFRSLVDHFGTARAALERLPDLARRGGAQRSARICSAEEAKAEFAASRKFGIAWLAPGEDGYPARLATLDDAPPLLAVRGDNATLMRPMIAIVVVVVEAAHRSGSLITARMAAEQGREVFAVPGSPLDPRAAGTNDLIKQGATLVTEAADVVNAVAPIMERPLMRTANEPDSEPFESDPQGHDRDQITGLLGPAPVTIDDLVRMSGASPAIVRTVLLELELAGRLERHGGGLVSLL